MTGDAGLGVLHARHIITNRLGDYCQAVDDRELASVVDLLAATDLTFRGHPVTGPAQIAEQYAQAFTAAGPTRHVVTDLRVEPASEPGVFTYRASYQRWSLAGGAPVCEAIGRYHGTFTPTGDRWVWNTHHVTT